MRLLQRGPFCRGGGGGGVLPHSSVGPLGPLIAVGSRRNVIALAIWWDPRIWPCVLLLSKLTAGAMGAGA